MAYTLFQANGKPLRATISVDGWRLDVRFAPGAGPAPGGANLPAHELTHVVQQRSTVRASVRAAPGRLPLAGRGPTTGLVPEVGDEVLISFACAVPRSTAVYFNPKEFGLDKKVSTLPADRGDVGMIRAGNYRVVPIQKGPAPLVLVLVCAADSSLSQEVQAFRFG